MVIFQATPITNELLEWVKALAAPVAALLVAIIALSGYFIARRTEEHKQFRTLQSDAYLALAKAVAEYTRAQALLQWVLANRSELTPELIAKYLEKESDKEALLVEAKTRITMYGSKKVVEYLAEFWRNGAALHTPRQMYLYMLPIQAIRSGSRDKRQTVLNRDISQLLFSQDINETSIAP